MTAYGRDRSGVPSRRGTAERPLAAAAVVGLVMALGACSATPGTEDSGAASPAQAGALPSDLQDELQAVLVGTMSQYDVPGAVAGVWLADEGLWTTAVGSADLDGGVAAATDMMWPLRSVMKSFTVTLVLQLVDEGAISLDDPIGDYVDGVTDGSEITLRELAGMTSGNADYTDEAFVEEFVADPDRIFTLDELNGFMLGEPALFSPGSKRVYTNANTNLLGAMIERVTGQDFAEALTERILEPLDLLDTAYVVDAALWPEPRPTGYAPGDAGPEPQPDNLSIFGPAGSMLTTVDDALVWGQALATGVLLSPETQAERQVGGPLESGPPYDIYALGMGRTAGWWGHNGEGLGFTAAVFHRVESDATIVVFMNESNVESGAHPADQAFRRIAHLLEKRVNG